MEPKRRRTWILPLPLDSASATALPWASRKVPARCILQRCPVRGDEALVDEVTIGRQALRRGGGLQRPTGGKVP